MEQNNSDKMTGDGSSFSQSHDDSNHNSSHNKRERSSVRSSTELRKLRPHILVDLSETTAREISQEQEKEQEATTELKKENRLCHIKLMQNTCLKPDYSLRKQMILAFGTTITLTILVVMLVSFLVTFLTANSVKADGREALKNITTIISAASPRYVSEILELKMPVEAVALIEEVVLDRFVGYPYHEGYEDDSKVPFFDVNTQRNVYPFNSSSALPLDWQIDPNVNKDNHKEHVQNRWSWYKNTSISTRSCAYLMQGMCDPSIIDSNDPTYFENCTDENNNLDTGGAVVPTPTNKQIARKAADLNFLMKSIYEQYQDVRDIGVYFANSGAGSALYFPHFRLDSGSEYKSTGCEWMSQPNPYDPSRPIAPKEEIKRCRPKGTKVSSRTFNVLENDWCQQMALDPFKTHIISPLFDGWGDNFWYVLIGKAVYDRLTDEFIGCIGLTVSLENIRDIVADVKILDALDNAMTKVTLVKLDEDGTVLASPDWDWSSATKPTTVADGKIGNGLTKAVFQEIKNLVNFSEKWDPKLARKKFEEYSHEAGDILISAHPTPIIPAEYTEGYTPEYIVVLSMDKTALQKSLNTVEDKSNITERKMYIIICACGVAGLITSLLLIVFASNYITKPLEWMNDVSEQIVDHFGRFDDEEIDHASPVVFRCSPKTELSALVEEFQKMISFFSGKGSAKVQESRLIEIKNNFKLFAEFKELYFSRMERGYKYNYNDSSSSSTITKNDNGTTADRTVSTLLIPRRCYLGENIVQSEVKEDAHESNPKGDAVKKNRVYSSPLFWWIMGLIVTPLLVTTIAISAIVTWRLSEELPSLFTTMEELYIDLGKDYIESVSLLRSDLTESTAKRGLRELQILNRVAHWLLFGGVERSGSFTEMITAVEECKYFELGTCPFLKNKTAAPCDCEWKDNTSQHSCYNYDEPSRYLQKLTYVVQNNQDTWPNGDRNSTSFPNISTSPSGTTWLDNVVNAPGFNKELSAEGYETTYDRMGVISALIAIQIPLYNYYKRSDRSLGTSTSFEADGMMCLYDGCWQQISGYSHWKSTEDNGASRIRPELCPLGMYGYDPRCREWYNTGKRKWKESSTDVSPLHVTAPYMFASTEAPGQTLTMPIVDPITKQHIGQSAVDFNPESIFSALRNENTPLLEDGFSFVIKADGGTVIGPGFPEITNDILPAIEELVIPYDEVIFDGECTDANGFEKILCDMKAGKHGTTEFTRVKSHRFDQTKETMYISYAPVNLKDLFPVDSSDFSRGVEERETMLYSIAFVIPRPTWFEESNNDLNRRLQISIAIFCALIVIGTVSLTSLLSTVTKSVTTPMLHLLEEIKKINRHEVHKSSLRFRMDSGSKDMQNIGHTFETLFLVVHLANSAYFSGELEVAHNVLVSTLSAFRRIQNKKAIGVASNNLGNVMLAMYRTLLSSGGGDDDDEEICGLNKKQIVSKGTKYFLQAIKVGEETYDQFYEEEGWSKNCLAFMQHLSNRYFNRAIFLLTTLKDHETPDSAKQMAFRDLEIVFDMDIEVVDQCIEMGIVRSKKEHFETIIGRIRGLLQCKSSYPDEWDVEELLNNALKLLKTVISNPTSDLFSNLGPAGRMQQLDCQLVNFIKNNKGDLPAAARIAIRMLVEDEYILSDAYMIAIGTLIEFTESEWGMQCFDDRATVTTELFATRTSACIQQEVINRNTPFLASANLRPFTSREVLQAGDDNRHNASIQECNRGDVTMETF